VLGLADLVGLCIGFYVLGLDYFFGDPVQNHADEPDFDRAAWVKKVKGLADEATPRWIDAVREKYGVSPTSSSACFLELTSAYTRPRRKVRRSWSVFTRIY
jgi:hypothetical protein